MVDVHETPAVPAFDAPGDVRLGYQVAGGILIALGWGLAVVVNLLAHTMAPSGGHRLWHVYFGPSLGPYAWGAVALGVATGALGCVLVWFGRQSPRGPFVLPGVET